MKSLRVPLSVFSLALIVVLVLFHPPAFAESEGNGVSQSNRQSTISTPDGSSATRSATRVWDPESKTWKRGITTEDEEGNAVTRYTETTKTEDGYQRNSVVVGPDGETATRSGRGTWDPETKTWKRGAVVAGPEGDAVSKGVEVKKTDEGYTRNSGVSDSEGSTTTRSARGVWDPETKTWKKSVNGSGAEGKTWNRQSNYRKRQESQDTAADQ